MARDWHVWHRAYDDPTSSLSRRLEVVRDQLHAVLGAQVGDPRLISMCAGDGRDVLPVIAGTKPDAAALLVEVDRELSDAARRTVDELGLPHAVVRTDDAGTTDAYRGFVPADVVLACGIFGNVTDDDVAHTVRALPMLLADRGVVIWTRGCRVPQDPTRLSGDPSEHVRRLFADAGFEELAFVRPDDADFRVGVHRLARTPDGYLPGVPLFTFV